MVPKLVHYGIEGGEAAVRPAIENARWPSTNPLISYFMKFLLDPMSSLFLPSLRLTAGPVGDGFGTEFEGGLHCGSIHRDEPLTKGAELRVDVIHARLPGSFFPCFLLIGASWRWHWQRFFGHWHTAITTTGQRDRKW